MAYNKAREERKWKQWKEKEEALLRILGMDEESIQELRRSDWEDFKAERRYQNHRAPLPEHKEWEDTSIDEQEVSSIPVLLDSISDEHLLHILLNTDKRTLQFLLLKMMGFSGREISEKTGISENTINTKIKTLRKKSKIFRKIDRKVISQWLYSRRGNPFV